MATPTTAHSFASLPTSQPPVIDADSLPSAQSAALKLEPATLLEYVQTAYLNADEWKGPLTIEQYLQREDILQAVNLTRDGRITGWILTTDSLPKNTDGSRPILASCESIPIHAYLARDGVVEKIQAHGIASVYNRPEHRGKGYASRMMAELGKRLETWQPLNGAINQFSVLFSDIGQTFYARFGWKVFPSTHIHLQQLNQVAYERASSGLPAVEDLLLEDLKSIPTVQYVERRLGEISKAEPGKIHVAIRPDLEHLEWHFARDEFQTKVMGKRFPEVKGVIHRPTGLALIWCRVYAAKKSDWQLHILHTVIPPSTQGSQEAETALAALLARAQLEAHEWEMASGVEVWDPSDLVVASAQRLRTKEQGRVEIITRDKEHLCSLRWTGGSDDNVVWLAKEKYAWC
jgi:GNAT superfamily N-acetyltransferase